MLILVIEHLSAQQKLTQNKQCFVKTLNSFKVNNTVRHLYTKYQYLCLAQGVQGRAQDFLRGQGGGGGGVPAPAGATPS